MRCLIKNIPPFSFRIAGNRGVGFPLADFCSDLLTEETCFLANEEDINSSIFTEFENDIFVTCTAVQPVVPEIITDCYLVKEEDGFTDILTENESSYLISTCVDPEIEICYLALQENTNDWIAQSENGDFLFVNC